MVLKRETPDIAESRSISSKISFLHFYCADLQDYVPFRIPDDTGHRLWHRD